MGRFEDGRARERGVVSVRPMRRYEMGSSIGFHLDAPTCSTRAEVRESSVDGVFSPSQPPPGIIEAQGELPANQRCA